MIKKVTEDISKILNSTGYSVNYYGACIDDLDTIVYTIIPQIADTVKEEYRLEITAISKDFVKAMNILDDVKKVILTSGDKSLTDNILSVVQTGGGNIYNYETETHHFKGYFILNVKNKEVNF